MPFRFIEEEASPVSEEHVSSKRFRFAKEEPSKLRSVLGAAPKGFLKELREQLMKTPILGKGLRELQRDFPEMAKSDEDVTTALEKYFPTQEGFTEQALERGGRISPYAIAGGGNIAGQAVRSALAGFLGEGAKELGAPDWAQAITELPAFASPGLGKQIIPKGSQKALVEGARRLGLKEGELTPLIQSESKQKFLAKAAPRRGRTKKLLDKSYQALGNVYDRLENLPQSVKELSPEISRKAINEISDTLNKYPNELRKVISEDFSDFLSEPVTGTSLINFFKDINYNIGKGHSRLGTLKEPIFKALEDISPEFANDFRLTNKLYSNYSKIAERIKPTLLSDLYSAGEAIRLITGVSLGNYPLIGELVGEHTARSLARELLLNPRLQNLSKKMVIALNGNKFAFANQIAKDYAKELREFNPEIADKIEEADFTSLLNGNNK